MEILSNTIQTTLESFDFAFCIIVNILTYLIIRLINDRNGHKDLTTWSKRLVLLLVILSIGVLYYLLGNDTKTILNSAILAPVFWSWIMKPICKHFKVDYKNVNLFDQHARRRNVNQIIMLKPRKIIRDYTPDYKALNTLDKQTKTIQDLYDQVSEFYKFLYEPAFRAEIKGEQGPQGEQGERGHDGAKGDKGATGNPGPQGSTGPRGATGAQGLPGPTGPQGPEGIPGPEGPRGPRGYTGLQGPQGLEGVPGEKGNMGEPWGLSGVFNTFDELQAEAVRADAKLYLVASMNDENGDLYVYREKYNDFIFLLC